MNITLKIVSKAPEDSSCRQQNTHIPKKAAVNSHTRLPWRKDPGWFKWLSEYLFKISFLYVWSEEGVGSLGAGVRGSSMWVLGIKLRGPLQAVHAFNC